MAISYLVGVFKKGTNKPLINVTVAEMASDSITILASAVTDSRGFATITPTIAEFIPCVLVSGILEPDVDFVVFPLGGSGSGPFWYNYLVDKRWDDVVDAGRGTEGQLFTTFHGYDFRVYSTLQAAITHGTTNLSQTITIRVVGNDVSGGSGTYDEVITIPDFSHEIYIWGSGKDSVLIGKGIGNNSQLMTIGTVDVFFKSLTLRGPNFDSDSVIMKSSSGDSMNIDCEDVMFKGVPMSGKHAGSHFRNCGFITGWKGSTGDEIENVVFEDCYTNQVFDFQTNSVPFSNTQMTDFRLSGVAAQLKFYTLSNSKIDFRGWTTAEAAVGNQIDVSRTINETIITGVITGPIDGEHAINIVLTSGVDAKAVKIILSCSFEFTTAGSYPDMRFIKVSGTGTAEGWHVDCGFGDNTVGDYLEEKDGISVEVDKAVGCKFTLVPHHIATILTNTGSSDNVVDAGVIHASSVGIVPPSSAVPGSIGTVAPYDAQYLVLATDADLSVERVFTPGTALSAVDSGAGAAYTLNHAAVASGDLHTEYLKEADFDDIDFLVGTGTGHTGAEIVVGTTPGGELGNTWASPTVDALHSGSKHGERTITIVVENPTSSEKIPMHFFFSAVTIAEVQAVVIGSSTPSVTIQVKQGTDLSAAGTDVLTSATAITNTTGGQNLTSFNDATVPADSHLWLITSAQSGTVTYLAVTIRYTYD